MWSTTVVLLLQLLLLLASTTYFCEASITVMDSGARYRSRADHYFGKVFVRGYEYMARLQHIEGNLALCPTANRDVWNLTQVPPDRLPGMCVCVM